MNYFLVNDIQKNVLITLKQILDSLEIERKEIEEKLNTFENQKEKYHISINDWIYNVSFSDLETWEIIEKTFSLNEELLSFLENKEKETRLKLKPLKNELSKLKKEIEKISFIKDNPKKIILSIQPTFDDKAKPNIDIDFAIRWYKTYLSKHSILIKENLLNVIDANLLNSEEENSKEENKEVEIKKENLNSKENENFELPNSLSTEKENNSENSEIESEDNDKKTEEIVEDIISSEEDFEDFNLDFSEENDKEKTADDIDFSELEEIVSEEQNDKENKEVDFLDILEEGATEKNIEEISEQEENKVIFSEEENDDLFWEIKEMDKEEKEDDIDDFLFEDEEDKKEEINLDFLNDEEINNKIEEADDKLQETNKEIKEDDFDDLFDFETLNKEKTEDLSEDLLSNDLNANSTEENKEVETLEDDFDDIFWENTKKENVSDLDEFEDLDNFLNKEIEDKKEDDLFDFDDLEFDKPEEKKEIENLKDRSEIKEEDLFNFEEPKKEEPVVVEKIIEKEIIVEKKNNDEIINDKETVNINLDTKADLIWNNSNISSEKLNNIENEVDNISKTLDSMDNLLSDENLNKFEEELNKVDTEKDNWEELDMSVLEEDKEFNEQERIRQFNNAVDEYRNNLIKTFSEKETYLFSDTPFLLRKEWFLDRYSKREKMFWVWIIIAIVFIVLLIWMLLSSKFSNVTEIDKTVSQKDNELQNKTVEIKKLQEELDSLKETNKQIEKEVTPITGSWDISLSILWEVLLNNTKDVDTVSKTNYRNYLSIKFKNLEPKINDDITIQLNDWRWSLVYKITKRFTWTNLPDVLEQWKAENKWSFIIIKWKNEGYFIARPI